MINANRTMGIEIEAKLPRGVSHDDLARAIRAKGVDAHNESYNHRTQSHWKVTTDASLGSYTTGVEIVSPILQGESGIADLKKVLEAANELGLNVDKACGIHIHWGIADLSLKAVKNVCTLYAKYEAQIDKVMPNSRRGNNNQYCRSINQHGGMEATIANIASARDMHGVRDAVNNGTRYRKLNLESFWRYSTMEFRQHAGSLDFDKISAWANLTAGIVEAGAKASRIKATGADKFEGLLKLTADTKTRRYYRKRQNELSS
jgi:hypothetical protein